MPLDSYPTTFIDSVTGNTVYCADINDIVEINGENYVYVTTKQNNTPFKIKQSQLSWIMNNVAEKLTPRNYKNIYPDQVNCIVNYDIVETDWIIKRWLPYDQQKMNDWYNDLIEKYKEWIWTYEKHKEHWQYDPNEIIGQFMQADSSWLMLTWGDDTKGPVPWLRYIAKPEYDTDMPRNIYLPEYGDYNKTMGARECFTGYARDIIENIPGGPHDIQVAIHTPGTKLPVHQDLPDKFRFHIPIITNSDAIFIAENKEIHLPADGWIYLVNTSILHSVDNRGNSDRVHIYGSVWTHQILDLDLDSLETIL